MANKATTTAGTPSLLKNKLSVLMKNLGKEFSQTKPETKEEVSEKFNALVSKFFSTLTHPILEKRNLAAGRYPDLNDLNQSFLDISQDLEVIYLEIESLKDEIVKVFNVTKLEEEKIKGMIQSTLGDIQEFRLSKREGTLPGLSDNFQNKKKIESTEKYYDEDICFLDEDGEGVTLPVVEDVKPKIVRATIGEGSNGTSGNNQEIGAIPNQNLTKAFDGKPDTWFEFEKITTNEAETPLVLELDLELKEPSIFNFINVLPLSFPGGNASTIIKLEGSIDNKIYTDIMPMYNGDTQTNSAGKEEIFLSAENGEPSKLWFYPQKIKFLKITFYEDSDYFILTPSGKKRRLAIGIKELELGGRKFGNKGEIITSKMSSGAEVSQVALKTTLYSPENFECEVQHFFSHDDGGSWNEISSMSEDGVSETQTVLRYNDSSENTIDTTGPVTELRYKCSMERVGTEKTISKTSTESSLVEASEFLTITPGTKNLNLENEPIDIPVILNVGFGSAGGESLYVFPDTQKIEKETETIYRLPRDPFFDKKIKLGDERVYAENFLWERTDDLSSVTEGSQCYLFDNLNNEIIFGGQGRIPSSKVSFCLASERAQIEEGDKDRIVTNYATDGVVESMRLFKKEETPGSLELTLKQLASVQDLGVKEISSITVTQDTGSRLVSEKSFVNGFSEILETGDFSVNKTKGILYSYDTIPANEEVKITVLFYPIEELELEIEDGNIYSKKKLEKENEEKVFDLNGAYVADFSGMGIVPNSILYHSGPSLVDAEIDYDKEAITFATPQTGELKISCDKYTHYIDYNLSAQIPLTDISFDGTKVTLSDRYILKYAYDSELGVDNYNLFKVKYEYTEEVEGSLQDLLPYVSPVLDKYSVFIADKE